MMHPSRGLLAATLAFSCLAEPALAASAADDGDATPENMVVVRGQRPSPYAPLETRIATKADTPLLQIPQSVQVVPREVLDDQAVQNLQNATRNVAGVTGAFGFSGVSNACVRVRGFTTEQGSVGCTYYRDGVRVWAQPMPFAALEAVEIVKGPNTVLFGRNEPGGIVNVVTKSPGPEPIAEARAWGGSFDTYGVALDVGGALNAGETLFGRVNAAYSSTNTFRDRVFNNLADVNLGLGWRPNAKTSVIWKFDLTRNVYRPDFGLPALGDKPAPVSVRQSYKQDYINSRTDAVIGSVVIDRELSNAWKLHANVYASYQEPEYFNVYGFGLNEDTLQYPVFYFGEQYSTRRTYQATTDFIGDVQMFGMRHKLLLGVDYFNERYNGPIYFNDSAPPVDLFNPQIGSAPPLFPTREEFAPFGSIQRWIGVYAQDQIHLSEQWILNLGARFDHATGAFAPDPVAEAVTQNAAKPRVGLVYLPAPNLSLYVQYQGAFGPNNGRSSTGEQFPGQIARQTEVGVKWRTPDGRLIATLAGFNLRKERLLTADPSTEDPFDSIAVGAVRNRGLELDVSGKASERLSLIASYSYSLARTVQDNSGFQGNAYEGVPRNAGSVWGRFQATRALALGGGVFAEGDRPGDLGNTFELPGYVRLDAFAQYGFTVQRVRWTAQINVENVLNQRYFAGIYNNSRDFIQPGSPRAVVATVKTEFR